MNYKKMRVSATLIALAAGLLAGSANAVPVLCEDTTVNHMYVDSAQVSSCLGAGVGNINGNPTTDDFLTGEGSGSGLVGIVADSISFTQSGNTGTFSFSSSLWDTWSNIAIGFKFGTGNNPDEWFVYALNPTISAGSWEFVNVFGRGGGLSHIQLYGSGPTVPEPSSLALLGIGMLAAGVARRRRKVS